MERKELEEIYYKTSEAEKLSDYLNSCESFNAIQDEANALALLDALPKEVREGIDRIEALARHRFDFRTDNEKRKVSE